MPRAEALDDFKEPWCQEIISDPSWKPQAPREESPVEIFREILWTDRTIRGFLPFYKEPPAGASTGGEVRWLTSLGSGLNGWPGVCHGGVLLLIFDAILHEVVHQELKVNYATITILTSFQKPVRTPAVVVCRAWVDKAPQGRKLWIKSTIEDGRGGVHASAEGFLVKAKL